MRRYWTGLAMAAVMVVSGCGLDAADPQDEAAPTAAATGEVKGKVTLQTWALKPKFTSYMESVISAFEKKHPGTDVAWLDQPADAYSDKVLSQAAGGTLPDVTNLPPDFARPLVKQGMLLDVSTVDSKLADEYVAGGLDAYRFSGHQGTYGYPWYLNTDVNYWNSELMAEYGLDPKQPPASFDELVEQARTMKEKSGGKVLLMSRRPEIGDLREAGVKLLSDDGKKFVFNTPEAAALVDKYRAAFKEGLMPRDVLTDTYAGNAKLFNEGAVAWTTGGGNHITSVTNENPSLAPKIVASPDFGTPPLYVQGLSISKKTTNLPTAIALARWVTSPENQAAFAHLVSIFPSTKSSANDPFFSKSDGTNAGDAKVIAFNSLAKAEVLQPYEVTDAMSKFIRQQISAALNGQISSKEALDAAVAKCNELLNQ
ncbi:ABC transporter substrate-binding protein [Streptosporangium roseum]|uniref:ABC-type sugar transport system periplasmic component-like protein n=1 Tax=Streptosporangium roseum (strain ATCC 12428 / DSM 43021 / JCM 3005 / KCTC 9067 / NCIMB 10171 / NRRL 2505 / NI 9100) TaxID=479432 RepID=D2B8J1_STRRD|nr:extracellular solute-binding protein [Streptosporangium roseum]ACZ87801.1 ABC-type sugar transport system periplasmic component-like protein [Streptosporangium roseum DSM 43021]